MLSIPLINPINEVTDKSPIPFYYPEIFLLKEKIKRLYDRIDQLESMNSYHSKRIALPFKTKVNRLPISKIVRCQSEDNYCHIILVDGSRLLISKTLKSIQNKINHPHFHRIHQSHLINQNHVRSTNKGSIRKILMTDGMTLPISRNFKIQTIL